MVIINMNTRSARLHDPFPLTSILSRVRVVRVTMFGFISTSVTLSLLITITTALPLFPHSIIHCYTHTHTHTNTSAILVAQLTHKNKRFKSLQILHTNKVF
jgi:hypothetical protein